MSCPSRRQLLVGLSSTVALATVGCLNGSDDDDAEDGLDTLFEFLPATEETAALDVLVHRRDLAAAIDDQYTGTLQHVLPTELREMNITRGVALRDRDGPHVLAVYDGPIIFAATPETRETVDGQEYKFYERAPYLERDVFVAHHADRVGATIGDVSLVARTEALLEAALAANRGAQQRLFDEQPVYAQALDRQSDAALVSVSTDVQEFDGDAAQLEYVALSQRAPSDVELETVYRFATTEPLPDERLDEILADLTTDTPADTDIQRDDTGVTVRVHQEFDHHRPGDLITSPGDPQVLPYDPEDDVVEIKLGRGDLTAVDDLTLEIDEEVIDREVWSDGQLTVEQGDTIVVPAGRIEPLTSFAMIHDGDGISSRGGTTLLVGVDFEASVDAEEISLTYKSEHPLEGDHVYVVLREGPGHGDRKVDIRQPWTGEIVTRDDEATVEEAKPGQTLYVHWRNPYTIESQISWATTDPPGVVMYEYDRDAERLTATLEVAESRDASKFELRVDGEPTGVQFSERADVIEDVVTVELEGLSYGTQVRTIYRPTEAPVDSFTLMPPDEVSVEYDPDEETLQVTFDVPESRPASTFEIRVNNLLTDTQPADVTDIIEDGDTITIHDIPPHASVQIYWTEPELQIGGTVIEYSAEDQ